MPNLLLYIVVFFLALVGLNELIRYVLYLLFAPKNSCCVLVVPLSNNEDAEIKLRGAIEKINILGGADTTQLIVLDLGLDDLTRDVCYRISSQSRRITLLKKEEFVQYMQARI